MGSTRANWRVSSKVKVYLFVIVANCQFKLFRSPGFSFLFYSVGITGEAKLYLYFVVPLFFGRRKYIETFTLFPFFQQLLLRFFVVVEYPLFFPPVLNVVYNLWILFFNLLLTLYFGKNKHCSPRRPIDFMLLFLSCNVYPCRVFWGGCCVKLLIIKW